MAWVKSEKWGGEAETKNEDFEGREWQSDKLKIKKWVWHGDQRRSHDPSWESVCFREFGFDVGDEGADFAEGGKGQAHGLLVSEDDGLAGGG